MPVRLLMCGGPLDGHFFEWSGTLDDVPGWISGGHHLNRHVTSRRWFYLQRLGLSLKLMDEVIEFDYSEVLSKRPTYDRLEEHETDHNT
jgi:hypothetical protein